MINITNVAVGAPILLATIASASPASAQVEEIVVTAQKRDENLQKVPISIVAVTQETAAAFGIKDTASLPLPSQRSILRVR